MTAAELLTVLTDHRPLLATYQVLIVDDDANEGEDTASYPLTRIVADSTAQQLQLMLRFPDEKSRGKAYKNLDAFLAEFTPLATTNPTFQVTATIKIKTPEATTFHHLPLTGLGTDDEEKILWLLAEGLTDLEEETQELFP